MAEWESIRGSVRGRPRAGGLAWRVGICGRRSVGEVTGDRGGSGQAAAGVHSEKQLACFKPAAVPLAKLNESRVILAVMTASIQPPRLPFLAQHSARSPTSSRRPAPELPVTAGDVVTVCDQLAS